MSDNKYSPIKLQLEEAIWLDHRAEDAEIISLELIPDVDIVEDDYFVNIRGQLVLIGRFETEEEGESLDLESSSLAEQLQFDPLHVEPKELYEQEYRGKIEHRFPFDVTVPANKIKQVEDIYVHVEQFDYTVTDGHRLQIKTEISITGIENEVEQDSKQEEMKKEAMPEAKVWSDFLPVRHKEAQEDDREVNDEQQREVNQELAKGSQAEISQTDVSQKERTPTGKVEREAQEARKEVVEKVEEIEKEETIEQVEKRNEKAAEKLDTTERTEQVKVKQAVDEARGKEAVEQAAPKVKESKQLAQGEAEINASDDKEMPPSTEENVVALFPQEIKTTFSSRPEKDGSTSTEEVLNEASLEDEHVREEQTNRTVSFLTQLMEHGDEESGVRQKRKLRMCIIQQNESLEDIAERYSISVYELMKANHLETDHISKGQILYIPSL